jgi:hypothetical protein
MLIVYNLTVSSIINHPYRVTVYSMNEEKQHSLTKHELHSIADVSLLYLIYSGAAKLSS